MRNRIVIVIVIAIAVTMVAQFADTVTVADTNSERPEFHATLISPRAGQILRPGEVVKVEWTASIPNIDPSRCESEFALSVDGGMTYPWIIGPWLDGNTRKFYWTVPDRPTNQAVLMVRYGCWLEFPESYSPQTSSMFVIAAASHDE